MMSFDFVFLFQDNTEPIMCSYKLVSVSFDVWALASRVESFVHRVSANISLACGCHLMSN